MCRTASGLLHMSGAAIMLRGDDGTGSSFGWSDEVVARLESAQFTVGEGPGIDAHTSGRPTFEARLGEATDGRWPSFSRAATANGIVAVFAFPLRVGMISLGALDLYRDRPGEMTGDEVRDAGRLASLVTDLVLSLQAGAQPGELPRAIDHVENLRVAVHQATGMLSEQLGIDVGDALVRLRARAYAEGRPVDEVAGDVVAGLLRIQ